MLSEQWTAFRIRRHDILTNIFFIKRYEYVRSPARCSAAGVRYHAGKNLDTFFIAHSPRVVMPARSCTTTNANPRLVDQLRIASSSHIAKLYFVANPSQRELIMRLCVPSYSHRSVEMTTKKLRVRGILKQKLYVRSYVFYY